MGGGASVPTDSSNSSNSNGNVSGSGSSNSRILFPCILLNNEEVSTQMVPISSPTSSSLSLSLLPSNIILKISRESLDILSSETSIPLLQFPYQNILCWGSSSSIFQFTVVINNNNNLKVIMRTQYGKQIEDTTMSTVLTLMTLMEKEAITKEQFQSLLLLIYDKDNDILIDTWMHSIETCSITRSFLAKQAMELMILISPHAPFEKFDLACLLYNRILNKDSFQLVINTFDNIIDRENLIHRLNLNKNKFKSNDDDIKKLVSSSKLLPEKISFPIKSKSIENDKKNIDDDNNNDNDSNNTTTNNNTNDQSTGSAKEPSDESAP
jgi:hypothetical protein